MTREELSRCALKEMDSRPSPCLPAPERYQNLIHTTHASWQRKQLERALRRPDRRDAVDGHAQPLMTLPRTPSRGCEEMATRDGDLWSWKCHMEADV